MGNSKTQQDILGGCHQLCPTIMCRCCLILGLALRSITKKTKGTNKNKREKNTTNKQTGDPQKKKTGVPFFLFRAAGQVAEHSVQEPQAYEEAPADSCSLPQKMAGAQWIWLRVKKIGNYPKWSPDKWSPGKWSQGLTPAVHILVEL